MAAGLLAAGGTLEKLVVGMNSEEYHSRSRTVVLQVMGIFPADMDQQTMLPANGFDIKVSDSSHWMYVRLPKDQNELVFRNEMRLGQLINVDGLEPGSPVPVIRGAKPSPSGRLFPLVGSLEPLKLLTNTKVRTRPCWETSPMAAATPIEKRPRWSDLKGQSPGMVRKKTVEPTTTPYSYSTTKLPRTKPPLWRRTAVNMRGGGGGPGIVPMTGLSSTPSVQHSRQTTTAAPMKQRITKLWSSFGLK